MNKQASLIWGLGGSGGDGFKSVCPSVFAGRRSTYWWVIIGTGPESRPGLPTPDVHCVSIALQEKDTPNGSRCH